MTFPTYSLMSSLCFLHWFSRSSFLFKLVDCAVDENAWNQFFTDLITVESDSFDKATELLRNIQRSAENFLSTSEIVSCPVYCVPKKVRYYQMRIGCGQIDYVWVRGSNAISIDHFGGRRHLAVVRLFTVPDLMRPHMVLCQSMFQSHDCRSPM